MSRPRAGLQGQAGPGTCKRSRAEPITEGWCQAKLSDIVLAIPAALTDVQRQAFLDACQISGAHCEIKGGSRYMECVSKVTVTFVAFRNS